MSRFMLEGPRPCTIFCFAVSRHTLCMNDVTKTFLLLSSSVRSRKLFVLRTAKKSEQKPTPTCKKCVRFHNHLPLNENQHNPNIILYCYKSVTLLIKLQMKR